MEKLASLGMLPAGRRIARGSQSGPPTGAEEEFYPTVGAKDVGEDGPQVLVVRQLVNHLRQAARRHFEEKGQLFGEAGGDQQLGQGGGADLQDGEEPNTPAGFLKMITCSDTIDRRGGRAAQQNTDANFDP